MATNCPRGTSPAPGWALGRIGSFLDDHLADSGLDDLSKSAAVSRYERASMISSAGLATEARDQDRQSEVALATTLLELLTVAQSKVEFDRQAAQACLSSATALLLANLERGGPKIAEPVSRGRLPRWQAKRLVTYIEENLDGPISRENLTALTGISAGHFFRTFKETFGQTPFAYIASRRIERAQQMMLTTHHPLAQIALDCGLCDQSHLTRLFRRLVGTTPSEWRREYAEPDHSRRDAC